MESLQPQIEDLTSDIDDLESALSPILSAALSASTSKLPLLDKAKLYVLATYAIESILFSFLRLNGIDAKAHPVFQELNRVKEYFQKIKTAEEIGAGGRSAGAGKLDKAAAGRFIKAGLAGNDRYDREREARREQERAGAKRKLEEMKLVGAHTRFDGVAKKIQASEGGTVPVVKASEADSTDDDSGAGGVPVESLDQAELQVRSRGEKKKSKQPLGGQKWKKAAAEMRAADPEAGGQVEGNANGVESDGSNSKKKKKRKRKPVE